jgi:hypothetical protein
MIKTKPVTIESYEIESVTCDVCHTEYTDIQELQEFHHINFRGGYSSLFGDETEVKCDICQHCLKPMIEKYMRTDDKSGLI